MNTLVTDPANRFNLNFTRGGFSIFLPMTRYTAAICFGCGWRITGRPGVFLPHLSLFRIGGRPFVRMWHLRRPYNVVRVGEWRNV